MRIDERSATSRGTRPVLALAARYLGETPKWVTPESAARRHSLSRDGYDGLPSYNTTAAPVAKPPTSQFHIIHPHVVNQNSRSPGWRSLWRRCSVRCLSRIPPAPWTMLLGRPVVPDEYMTYSGWSKGSWANVGSAASPRMRSSHVIAPGTGSARRRCTITTWSMSIAVLTSWIVSTMECSTPLYRYPSTVMSTFGAI